MSCALSAPQKAHEYIGYLLHSELDSVENYGASTIQAVSSLASKLTSSSLNAFTKQNTNKQVE